MELQQKQPWKRWLILLLYEIESKVVIQAWCEVYEIYNFQALSSTITALVCYILGPSRL